MSMIEEGFQGDRLRVEILEQENIEIMLVIEEVFQEDTIRLEKLELRNIKDMSVT